MGCWKGLRYTFFDNLKEIIGVFRIKEFKWTAIIKRSYQFGITVYQLAKLHMFEFYYNFLEKYLNSPDNELRYIGTDSFYLGLGRCIRLKKINSQLAT